MTPQVPYPIRSGVNFRDGKLYRFSYDGIIVLRQWPDLRAWRKTPKGPWKQIRPGLEISRIASGWQMDIGNRASKFKPVVGGIPIATLLARGPADLLPPMQDDEPDDPIPPPDNNDGVVFQPYVEGTRWRQHELDRIQAYLQPIPAEVLEMVAKFPGRHWHLLSLIARCPGAVDLVRSIPALAFALASLWVFRQPAPRRPLRSVRTLLGKPQSQIVGWLGFPATRSMVRILRKLPPCECNIPNLLHLRQLTLTHAKALRHMSRLGTENLRLMVKSGPTYQLGSAYLSEMGTSPAPEWLAHELRTVRDVLWLREHLGDEGVITFNSHAHLLRIHDQLVHRIGRTDLATLDPTPLPAPPFPGTASAGLRLEPITTERGLLEEGIAQSNCVGAYGSRIRRGILCIYRVDAPERATLSIVRGPRGKWELGELKAPHNAAVAHQTETAIKEWLQASNNSASSVGKGTRKSPTLEPDSTPSERLVQGELFVW